VVPAPHGQWPGWQIAKQLAERLGIGECMPFKDMEEYLRYRVEKSELSWDTLKREGVILGKPKPIFVEDGAELAFDTPSGKVEFWSQQLADKGFDPVPKFRPPDPGPAGHFRLITGRAPVHTFSRTQNNRLLFDLMPTNEVWVNADTARQLGLASGQFVQLRNQDGVVSNRIRVKATQRIRPDTVYMVYGFGHTNRQQRLAFGQGANAAQLLTKYETDPLMGGTSLHSNFVTFVKEGSA
jgi:thiosulfate reductase/polysulfide reductase chain A